MCCHACMSWCTTHAYVHSITCSSRPTYTAVHCASAMTAMCTRLLRRGRPSRLSHLPAVPQGWLLLQAAAAGCCQRWRLLLLQRALPEAEGQAEHQQCSTCRQRGCSQEVRQRAAGGGAQAERLCCDHVRQQQASMSTRACEKHNMSDAGAAGARYMPQSSTTATCCARQSGYGA
jgi:hypothetical protein